MWGSLIGAGASLLGGVLGARGRDRQADAMRQQAADANARAQTAAGYLSPRQFGGVANWMFPGLLPQYTGTFGDNSVWGPNPIATRMAQGFTSQPAAIEPSAGYYPASFGGVLGRMGGAPGLYEMAQQTGTALPPGAMGIGDIFSALGIQPRQDGGPVNAGDPYLVGEAGPEIIVPEVDAEVLPNPTGGRRVSAEGYQASGRQSGGERSLRPTRDTGRGSSTDGSSDATSIPQPTGPAPAYPGNLAVAWLLDMLMSPGRMDPSSYHRAQEQANVGLTGALQAGAGGLAGRGIDPGSELGQTLATSAALGAAGQRNEAARDYSLAQEQLRRQDIQQAIATYMNMLGASQNLQSGRAAALTSQPYQMYQPVNTMQPYADALTGVIGPWLARQDWGRTPLADQFMDLETSPV